MNVVVVETPYGVEHNFLSFSRAYKKCLLFIFFVEGFQFIYTITSQWLSIEWISIVVVNSDMTRHIAESARIRSSIQFYVNREYYNSKIPSCYTIIVMPTWYFDSRESLEIHISKTGRMLEKRNVSQPLY